MTAAAGPVGVISNPGSGHNRDQFDAIAARLARCSALEHAVTTHPDDIDPVLARFAAAGTAVLAINGGDGTASAVLGRLLESAHFPSPPLIVLLPGGTANMNAGDVGVRGPLGKAVERFCRWCEGPRESAGLRRERCMLRVTGLRAEPVYSMFLGAGAVIHGTEYAHERIHSRGLRDDFSLALGTARTVWGVLRDDPRFNRHVGIRLALDDAPAQHFDTLILAVSTLQRLSFGMRPFFGQGPGDIRLTLFEQGCSRFARTFASIIRGRPNRNAVPASGYHSHNAQRLRLDMRGGVNLDGEVLQADGPFEVSAAGPLAFLRL